MKIINLIVTNIVGASLIFGLSGCASKPSALKAKQIPKNKAQKYNKYNCSQIENKLYFLNKEEKRLRKEQNDIVSNEEDRTFLLSILIVSIPLIPFLNGDGETAEQYQIIKGELDYIKELAIEKSCNINIQKSNVEVEID